MICNRLYQSLICLMIMLFSSTEGKGFGGRGGSGGFKTGSRGPGTFGGASSFSRGNSINAMNKPRSGSSFKSNAASFAAGAAGGLAAYTLMRSMSHSYHARPSDYYRPGYGIGDTCVNNEDMNGTSFGTFRCPLYGFSPDELQCCGEPNKQYCCSRRGISRNSNSSAHFAWIVLIIACLLLVILLWARRCRKQKDMVMIPTEPPMNQPPPFYNPPPPPMSYPPPPAANPYAYPPQNYPGNFNPYAQQSQPFNSY
ncbi:unnamed protein product [Adineta ricciae]|uniref:Shisa N-terminal domain-containing protein n=1 Tax=Adineta ricciae TaxID=249248 RepID=A0A813XZM2_ADIRI|nr:unnamed protein product [Adineta ricciae]CAF1239178.1 unnamed protein product [Adineta ricciae]